MTVSVDTTSTCMGPSILLDYLHGSLSIAIHYDNIMYKMNDRCKYLHLAGWLACHHLVVGHGSNYMYIHPARACAKRG